MQDIQLNSDKANIILRTSLVSLFYDTVHKEMKDIGCKYFNHQLIKNYDQRGHMVSSFCTDPDWQLKYWQDYWDCDPLERVSYKITKHNGSATTLWNIVDPNSDIMEYRKSACKLSAGLTFCTELENGVLENFSFGWEKYDVNRVNRQKLAKLCNMVTDFRMQHFQLNKDMFEIVPDVDSL
ncbi:MAG: hypothetical protein ACOH2E_00570 [Candidatus Paracaedibacter sp.]